jgi:hypothetical protein
MNLVSMDSKSDANMMHLGQYSFLFAGDTIEGNP